ncbi:centrosomal protein of 55 kDa isoform X1 [Oxyura jamaicensis]|uniref:centrosomal protein of 55 kDa isoform X1 n=1 Tax=Oxyura jamaicensis TaxID=8884 RepID=UPI0015A6DF0F|nr:centrosomal protein of 55 kDa isoform X1 [Oxyura jamaicensis]
MGCLLSFAPQRAQPHPPAVNGRLGPSSTCPRGHARPPVLTPGRRRSSGFAAWAVRAEVTLGQARDSNSRKRRWAMSAWAGRELLAGRWRRGHGDGPGRGERDGAAPRKPPEEALAAQGPLASPERSSLLQKIFSLEKEKQKHNHLLGEKDKEIQNLKDKLKSKNKNSEVSSLQSQLEEKTKEAERREQLLSSLSEEMNRLKCNLSTVTAKCSELENKANNSHASEEAVTNSTGSSTNLSEVEKQLKDALEKNQQWLLYDQQREVYVRGLLGRIFELEKKSEIVSQQQPKESNTEGHLPEEKQKYYDQLLLTAKSDLETERRTITQLRCELHEFKKKYEETQREMMSLNDLLQSQQAVEMKALENENKIKGEKVQRLKQENESIKVQLREEKEKSEELLSQVQLLRKSLLKQQEEHTRIALLEQQIQICTTDFENEKLDRQNLQHQLNQVLKELRKAREQITRLEPLKLQESGCVEPQEDLQAAFEEKVTVYDRSPSQKHSNLLDESFLECPRCKVQYPTSQHRELLAHIDFCTA